MSTKDLKEKGTSFPSSDGQHITHGCRYLFFQIYQ